MADSSSTHCTSRAVPSNCSELGFDVCIMLMNYADNFRMNILSVQLQLLGMANGRK